jgi:hypothetical protein
MKEERVRVQSIDGFFFILGFIALIWVAVLKYYAMELTKKRKHVVGMGSSSALLGNSPSNGNNDGHVPWLTYLSSRSLW